MTGKLTIILPTRDRAETLRYALKTIADQQNPNIEIIISDNFSGPDVKAVADECKDKRLRYIRTSERMGMSEHWDFALGHVTGDWVTIIGDDDGLLPGAVDRFFELAEKHPDIKAITSANCTFRWPNSEQTDGKLSLVSGKGYEIRNSSDVIRRTMYGEIIAMPTIYTGGFVNMDIINEAKARSANGKFFQSLNPDIYSGFAITSIIDKYIYTYEAFGIAGSSKYSIGGQHQNKTKEEMQKLDFHHENKIPVHPVLGTTAVESMQVILYEAFLQSGNLRNDDFGVTLEQQLELALTHSYKRVRSEVFDYCKMVADRNGLDFEKITKKVKTRRWPVKIKRIANKIKRRTLNTSKLPKKTINDNNVRTVYDAARKCGEMIS